MDLYAETFAILANPELARQIEHLPAAAEVEATMIVYTSAVVRLFHALAAHGLRRRTQASRLR